MAKEKKYGLSTVAQSNKLVEAIHGMTLTEKRLFIHASGLARQQNLKEGEVLTITPAKIDIHSAICSCRVPNNITI